MERDFQRKNEFLSFFQGLQQQKDLVYKKEQLLKLNTYYSFLFDCFLWNYKDSYLKVCLVFEVYTRLHWGYFYVFH